MEIFFTEILFYKSFRPNWASLPSQGGSDEEPAGAALERKTFADGKPQTQA